MRRQATITLRCMQALVRVQARVRARRVRMSDEGQAVQRQLLERRQLEYRPRKSTVRSIVIYRHESHIHFLVDLKILAAHGEHLQFHEFHLLRL